MTGVLMISLALVADAVIGNVQGVLQGFSDQGLIGLVAVWILYHIYNRK